jgi:hypothetical protein
MPKLTDTKLIILSAAAQRDDRSALPLPTSLKLKASPTGRVLKSLVDQKLLNEVPAEGSLPVWRECDDQRIALIITDTGLNALGIDINGSRSKTASGGKRISSKKQRPSSKGKKEPTAPRADSKLDQLLGLLSAKDGSTTPQMIAATGWQSHTVRAAITGLRKRGYAIERHKSAAGETVYARVGD